MLYLYLRVFPKIGGIESIVSKFDCKWLVGRMNWLAGRDEESAGCMKWLASRLAHFSYWQRQPIIESG